jgi:hypothetical protein
MLRLATGYGNKDEYELKPEELNHSLRLFGDLMKLEAVRHEIASRAGR